MVVLRLHQIKQIYDHLFKLFNLPYIYYHHTTDQHTTSIKESLFLELNKIVTQVKTYKNICLEKGFNKFIKGLELFTESCIYEDIQTISKEIESIAKNAFEVAKAYEEYSLSTKLRLACVILRSDYYINPYCHVYGIGMTCVEVIDLLIQSYPARISIDDEFDPLLLPRRGNPMTRIPILRDISALNAFVGEIFGVKSALVTTTGKKANLIDTKKLITISQDSPVHSCIVVNDFLLLGCQSGIIEAWNLLEYPFVFEKKLIEHDEDCSVNTLLAVNEYFYSGSEDCTVCVWNAIDLTLVQRIRKHEGYISHLIYCAPLNFVISGSMDKTIRLWDPISFQENGLIVEDSSVRCIVTDGCHLFSSCGSSSLHRTIKVWDLSSKYEVCQLQGHEDYIISMVIVELNHHLVSSSADNTMRVWDLNTLLCLNVINCTLSPNNLYAHELCLLGCGEGNKLMMWRWRQDTHVEYEECSHDGLQCGKDINTSINCVTAYRGEYFVGTYSGNVYEKLIS